jgi:hypothetical protein
MPWYLATDDSFMEELLRAGADEAKKAEVTGPSLEEVPPRTQSDVIELFGTVEVDSEHDYKTQRRRLRAIQAQVADGIAQEERGELVDGEEAVSRVKERAARKKRRASNA